MNNNQIVDVLKESGPLLSNELIKKLVTIHGINEATARTRIKRAAASRVISVSPAKFKNNSRLYFLKDQPLKNKVIEIMTPIDSPESHIFNALSVEHGFLFWDEFCKLTACSLHEIPRKKTVEQVVENLSELNVITVVNADDVNNRYVKFSSDFLNSHFSANDLELRRRSLHINRSLLEELINWLERISIVGWNTGKISNHGDLVVFNGYPFDARGFSYILGLYRTDKKDTLYNPSMEMAGSPVLVDCIVHRATKIFDIVAFIKRIENVNGPINLLKNPNFKTIPIFFVTYIDSDAHELAKRKGIIIIPIKEVFDNNFIKVLEKIMKLPTENITLGSLEEILEIMQISPQEEKEPTVEKMGVSEGIFNNLKGIVFNFVIAYIFAELGYGQQKIGTIYKGVLEDPEVKEPCECDLTSATRRSDTKIICEVKVRSQNQLIKLGENRDEKDSVKRFFERTHRIIQNPIDKNQLFYIPIFITSSEFEGTAIEYMDRRLGKEMKAKIERLGNTFPRKLYYGKQDLIELSNYLESGQEIRRILNEYF